ncbi:hypothetical protein EWM64_g4803 [Hericium alpestre]|uniref:CWF21 domain-containing protein n=1 Tax=Hericium alpestre TaxID=135208 RepID=A0A4Y9ZYP1_9AGAM|nr:hypothetical protein EWM64_g4803 [Hericium alpestre]
MEAKNQIYLHRLELRYVMYNGIGLTTPRGSGTNGYVVRNLSTLRIHDTAADRAKAWDTAPPKHREPDGAILEHERQRKVEVKCLELQLQLEDEEVDGEVIEKQVVELRERLLKTMVPVSSGKSLKPSDTHAIAAAKKAELSKMAAALGTRSDYIEGDAFDREKQEEQRLKRMVQREERDQQREEERKRMQEQKEKWELERKERDRLRRREEDKRRKEMEERRKNHDDDDDRRRMPPPPPLSLGRDRDRGPPRDYRDRRSRSPPRRGPPRDIDMDEAPPRRRRRRRVRRHRLPAAAVSNRARLPVVSSVRGLPHFTCAVASLPRRLAAAVHVHPRAGPCRSGGCRACTRGIGHAQEGLSGRVGHSACTQGTMHRVARRAHAR